MVGNQPENKDERGQDASLAQVVLAVPLADRLVLILGFPVLGLLIGVLFPLVARWALGLSNGLRVRPVSKFFGSVDEPREIAVHLAVWLVVGLVIAFTLVQESMRVTLTDGELRADKDGRARTIPRADVAAVFLDGKRLVVQDHASRQLVRDVHEASRADLAGAFRAHGYPWRDADPYADLYRHWLPDTPDLSLVANAVLSARETALKNKAGQEIRDMRDTVEELGSVVRDESTRQYWRPWVRS